MIGCRVDFLDPQQTTHIRHEVGQQIGSTVRQQTLRHTKQRYDLFRQKSGNTNGLLIWGRKNHGPLCKQVLKDYRMLVPFSCFWEVHDIYSRNLERSANGYGAKRWSGSTSCSHGDSTLWTVFTVVHHICEHSFPPPVHREGVIELPP